MAELSAFGFRPGTSVFHRLDPRFKLAGVMVLGLATFRAGPIELALGSLLLFWSVRRAGLPLGRAVFELRFLALLLLMVFAARALGSPGEVVWRLAGMGVSREGMVEGGLICWRLVILTLTGLVMTATTRTSQIRAGVQALLGPMPGIPAQRIATAMGLVMRFVPMILGLVMEISQAQKARGVENRKNPVYRTRCLALPLLRRSVQKADRLAMAMAARGYCEERTTEDLKAGASDWVALGGCFLFLVLSL